MSVTIYTHPSCLKHEMGAMHPESPKRLEAIAVALKQASFADQLIWKEAPLVTQQQLEGVHQKSYIQKIFSLAPQEGYKALDPDTLMNPYTLEAARRAAGALIAAVDEAYTSDNTHAFCLVRPPGHHAEPDKAMGFCLFNNIAVGVVHVLNQYDPQARIAIIDFDVHHGNGTETMFYNQSNVFFWSSFQHPFYPGANLQSPKHIHLCPLTAGTTGEIFREKVMTELIPQLEVFQPECIFISAGFDAHRRDPLANLLFEAQDYAFVTKELCKIAEKYGKKRVISTLEGGYDLVALAESAKAHIQAML